MYTKDHGRVVILGGVRHPRWWVNTKNGFGGCDYRTNRSSNVTKTTAVKIENFNLTKTETYIYYYLFSSIKGQN